MPADGSAAILALVWPIGEDFGRPQSVQTERDANARLMAAAPAMLQALRLVSEHCAECVCPTVLDAIALAEGR